MGRIDAHHFKSRRHTSFIIWLKLGPLLPLVPISEPAKNCGTCISIKGKGILFTYMYLNWNLFYLWSLTQLIVITWLAPGYIVSMHEYIFSECIYVCVSHKMTLEWLMLSVHYTHKEIFTLKVTNFQLQNVDTFSVHTISVCGN